jgi:hypothetical protein
MKVSPKLKTHLAFALALLAAGTAYSDPAFRLRSGPAQVALLELYSSEGCNSCPPAEAWLNRQTESPGLWRDFVPVDFHVDYWNYLGWVDRWSAPEFSLRQRDYAAQWHAANIYTPEFFLNGSEWQNWFGWRGSPGQTGRTVGELLVTTTNRMKWEVVFAPANPSAESYQVHATLLAGGIHTTVGNGENAGRVLAHEFVAQDLVNAGLHADGTVQRGRFLLTAPARTDVTRWGIAVWVTQGYAPTPVQAVGGWLPEGGH